MIKKKIDINNFIILLIIAAVFLLIVFNLSFSRKALKEIRENGDSIIGKFTGFKKFPKSIDCSFQFYYHNNKMTIITTNAPNGFHINTGKFYKLKYLDKYPDMIIVEFNHEISDTSEILKAGFSMEDL